MYSLRRIRERTVVLLNEVEQKLILRNMPPTKFITTLITLPCKIPRLLIILDELSHINRSQFVTIQKMKFNLNGSQWRYVHNFNELSSINKLTDSESINNWGTGWGFSMACHKWLYKWVHKMRCLILHEVHN